MSDEARKVAEVFGRSAPSYDSVIPFFATFGNRLVELADLASGTRVLDAGCGRGAALVPAAREVGPSGASSGSTCPARCSHCSMPSCNAWASGIRGRSPDGHR